MKFGALLRSSAQEVPELQGLFVCYKQLKKRLKLLPDRLQAGEPGQATDVEVQRDVRMNERAFVALLIADIQAFNETFVEREEQSVIQLSLIEDKAAAAHDTEEIAGVYKVQRNTISSQLKVSEAAVSGVLNNTTFWLPSFR